MEGPLLPKLVLHNAVSIDGRLEGFMPDIALYYQLVSTWQEDATLVGSNTILAAPEEDADLVIEGADRSSLPLMIVPDSRGRIRSWESLRRQPFWRDIIVLTSKKTPAEYLDYLRELGMETICAGDDKVDLRAALETLALAHGIKTVRVDSGGTLNGVLLRAGLVDEVSILVHPWLVGGLQPSSIFQSPEPAPGEQAIRMQLISVQRLESDILWLRYAVAK